MRLKVMPWVMLFIAATLIIFAFSFYYNFKNQMIESTELKLFNYADNILIEIAEKSDLFIKKPGNFIFSSSGNEFTSSGVLVEFVDNNGKPLSRSPALKNNTLHFTKSEEDIVKDFELDDGTRIKTYQKEINIREKKLGYLIVGVSTSQLYHSLDRIKAILGVALLLTFAVLGVGIYAMTTLDLVKNQKLFLGFASHELRTPLSVISGNAELALRDREIGGQLRDKLLNIKEESDWMNSLVSNLLLMIRSQTGEQKTNKTAFCLSDILVEAISSLKGRYPAKNITLTLPDNADIKADPDQIKILIGNILENAARNTKESGIIEVKLEAEPKRFLLTITDDGKGIDPASRKKIFDAFYQVEEGKGGGVGLGLAISKWIVEAHRGTISVQSEKGKGSAFCICLPKAQG